MRKIRYRNNDWDISWLIAAIVSILGFIALVVFGIWFFVNPEKFPEDAFELFVPFIGIALFYLGIFLLVLLTESIKKISDIHFFQNHKKELDLANRERTLDKLEDDIKKSYEEKFNWEKQVLQNELDERENRLLLRKTDIEKLLDEKQRFIDFQKSQLEDERKIISEEIQSYPWLADLVAEYYYLRDGKVVNYLDTKRNPAYKAAEIVSEYSRENRTLRKSLKQAEYQIAVYESVFPWLEEFKEIPPSDVVASMSQVSESEESKSEYETLKFWLSPEEYNQLSNVEKYQLALDRYDKRNKSNWEIGREYERYIGFLYEKKGYAVSYVGALMGLEDMGRDLIAKKNNKILIIQCKNWAERKTIHEKHIFQLFGSVTEYNIDNDTKAKGVFVSTCDLSDKAQAFADQLKIKCSQVEFKHDYPKIKCNISERTGEKIYHLPFDQQYDRIIIESEKGECYVGTVAEAERKGFRRAKRYIPESP